MQTYPKNLLPKPKGRRTVGVLPASPRASAQWRKEAHFTVLLCVVAQLALQNVPGHSHYVPEIILAIIYIHKGFHPFMDWRFVFWFRFWVKRIQRTRCGRLASCFYARATA